MTPRPESRMTATLHSAQRRQNTPDGGPRWDITTSAGIYRTDDDTQVAFDVPNHVGDNISEPWTGKRVEFTMRGEKIIDWQLADDQQQESAQ